MCVTLHPWLRPALLALAGLAGCGAPAAGAAGDVAAPLEVHLAHPAYAGTLRFDAGAAPAVGRSVRARLAVTAADGAPVPATALATPLLWMPQHGHGGIGVPRLAGAAEGAATWVEDIAVQMSGAWELRVTATAAGVGTRLAFAFDVP